VRWAWDAAMHQLRLNVTVPPGAEATVRHAALMPAAMPAASSLGSPWACTRALQGAKASACMHQQAPEEAPRCMCVRT
jgi:hypothetical protein